MRLWLVRRLFAFLDARFYSYGWGGFERLPWPWDRLRAWCWRQQCALDPLLRDKGMEGRGADG